LSSSSEEEEEADEFDLDDGGEELLLDRDEGLPKVDVDPAKEELGTL